MESKFYQIDEVAKITEISKRTIRYYEFMGLLAPARSDASYRLYTKENIDEIIEIRNLKINFGMNLEQVKRYLGLKKTITEILEGKIKEKCVIAEAEKKIKELQKIAEEREAVLKKIKNNCQRYLEQLNSRTEQLEKK